MIASSQALARRLIAVALVNTVAVNLVLLLTVGADTTLHYLGAFLVGLAAEDSWQPMRLALEFIRAHPSAPVYDALFVQRDVQFIYPPTSLLFIEPFGSVSPNALPSNAVLNLMSWVAVAATVVLTARIFALSARAHLGHLSGRSTIERAVLVAVVSAMALEFYPLLKAFRLGQIQTWMTCLFAGASLAWLQKRDRISGVLCGLICLVKPQLALIAAWGLIRGHRRFVEGWLAAVLPLVAASIWRYGVANHYDYFNVPALISRHGWSYYPNQSVSGLLNRLMFLGNSARWEPHGVPFNPLVYAGTILTALVLIGVALIGRSRGNRDADVVDFFVAALSFTMASPLAWDHHYGILLPMFAMVLPLTLMVWSGRAGPVVVLALAFVLTSNGYHLVVAPTAPTRFNVVQSYLFVGALLMLAHLYRLRRRFGAAATA